MVWGMISTSPAVLILLKAVDQALLAAVATSVALEMVVLGEASDVRHQQDGIGAVEATAQVTGDVDHALEFSIEWRR